ncbi:MAG TPA: PhoPQ-activated protein PqaA family protein, partial [Candidatus Hydrogenedentes bacterium]|nr:PhoPQ-activated protein PqaA family protein [Candidatus Hydrogenedentota bacterium]
YTSTRPISPVNIDGFVVVGASKRGWTTWLTAAADSRVVAAVPIVIDVLNMEQQMVHHRRAYSGYAPADYTQYKIFGGYSTAIRDYVEMNVFQRFGTPESASLLKIVDPITYASRLTMPKLIANSTGDQFFLLDSSRFYWNQLPGENYLYYAPNTDHGLTGSGTDVDSDTLDSIFAFYYAQLLNRNRSTADDVRLPGYTWQITPVPSENKVRITMRTEVQPIRVQLWQAFNPEYRDFRLQVLGAAWTRTRLYSPCEQNCLDLDLDPCDCSEEPEHVYEAEVDVPGIGQGWRAFLVRMIFPGFTLRDPTATNPADQVKTVNFTVSTPVQVVPDIYPDEL